MMIKSLVDSSIARPLLSASEPYTAFLRERLAGSELYISPYIAMELKRSLILPLIEFYGTMCVVFRAGGSFGDAEKMWQNQYSNQKKVAVGQLVGELFSDSRLDLNDLRDRDEAKRTLVRYIFTFLDKIDELFTDTGQDPARCARAALRLRSAGPGAERLKDFAEAFEDCAFCRKSCRIDHFFLVSRQQRLEAIIAGAHRFPKRDDSDPFHKIVERLNRIVKKGRAAFSCHECMLIGDAVIAMAAPEEMQIEHSDRSFDQLCDILEKPHRHHPAEPAFYKQLQEDDGAV